MSTATAPSTPAAAPPTPSTPSQLVPIGEIQESKTNPRKTFDPAFIAELKTSMQRHGFFGAILVRPHPSKANAFELVAGAQRLRAAKEAGLSHVPAEIRALTDDEVIEIQIVENLTRRDLLPLEVIHITWDYMSTDDVRKEKGERIYSCKSWTRADGKFGSKACASSITGVVVAGNRDYGLAFDVCAAKKTCQVHYKAEIRAAEKREKGVAKSGKTGADRYALENKKREEERDRVESLRAKFAGAIPEVMAAMQPVVNRLPTKATGLLAELICSSLPRAYGRAAQNAGPLVQRGKSAEDLIRYAAWRLIVNQASDWNAFQAFPPFAKKFGVDVAKILAAQAEPIVEKCRVCGCTKTTPCDEGFGQGCAWVERPNKKTGLGLCSVCAAKTDRKPASKAKK